MTLDLTYQELNQHLGVDIFSFEDGKITLNASLVTGNSDTSIDNYGVIKLLSKLLKTSYEVQEQKKVAGATDNLNSFSRFYSTVDDSQPITTIKAEYRLLANVPFDFDNLTGSN